MSETLWHVTLDGVPLEGRYDRAQVQALLGEYPDRSLLVWKEGLEGWLDPRTQAGFSMPDPSRPTGPGLPARGTPAPSGWAQALPGLFDARFDQFISLKILSFTYVLVMALAGVVFLFLFYTGGTAVVNGLRFGVGGQMIRGLLILVFAPLIALFSLAITRVFLELAIVLFKIKAHTEPPAGRIK
jgi:hypothetical protein